MGQDGANRYAYVYNHPTAFIDPSGFDGENEIPTPDPYTVVDVNWGSLADPFGPVTPIYLGQVEIPTYLGQAVEIGGSDGYAEGQAYGENVGNQFGSDAVFGDGFDSGEASVPKFELAAVRTGPDPASDTNGGTAQKSFWASFMIGAAMNPAGAVVALAAEGAVLVGEAIVAVEENLPEIKAVGSEVVTEASELGSAEMSRFSAEMSQLGAELSELGSFVSEQFSRVSSAEGVALAERQAAAEGMQAHHVFPQAAEFAPTWESLGINIDQFRLQLSEGSHLGQIHGSAGIPGIGPGGLWNEIWRQYIGGEAASGRGLTQFGVFNQAATMVNDFGIQYYTPIVVPYP